MTDHRERLALWIEQKLPRPKLRPGATGRPRGPVKRIIVFGRMPNPTFDYYFAARLDAPGMLPSEAVDIRHGKLADLAPEGAFIIICRYASPDVLTWLDTNADRLSGVGLFVDDDIPAVATGRDASLRYRFVLCFRALWPLRRLNRHLDIVWASTPHLASTLQLEEVQVLPPAPPERLWRPRSSKYGSLEPISDRVLIAYHATGVHLEEHRFLRPIIEEILEKRPEARFEVFADARAASIWEGMERVSVRRPIPWNDYVADANNRTIDVMLVPLHPSRVNDSRAPTKRIDVARYKAAGVFSEGAAYGYPGEDAELRLPYNARAWCQTIDQLVEDLEMRRTIAAATRQAALQMTLAADTGFEALKACQNASSAHLGLTTILNDRNAGPF
ncbi:hypothetical protein AC244_31310 [Ensifer adhaerens]|uniref:Glycosyltransferase family 1 protein n=1 Tax=Ensifer adhaerens TaxID=106592 RepID=A0A0L8BFG9_ENSAD|nr:hypothetical protein [Ensifer adhaerens]KOF13397.1 hypothetical protein AC244_31310 [Ensifer adhaerens]